jgi:DNA-binding transcriptional regulator YiaG
VRPLAVQGKCGIQAIFDGCGTITRMPNIATVLKVEVSRVARKEVRGELVGLKKAASAHRAEIAALKRRVQALESALRLIGKTRRRLGLSAEDCGLLVAASGQSIYNWESGHARPRAKHLSALAVLRTLGKKAAATRLASLREAR